MGSQEQPRLEFGGEFGEGFVGLAGGVGVTPEVGIADGGLEGFLFGEFFVETELLPGLVKVGEEGLEEFFGIGHG